jgi:hypothetical protein
VVVTTPKQISLDEHPLKFRLVEILVKDLLAIKGPPTLLHPDCSAKRTTGPIIWNSRSILLLNNITSKAKNAGF